MMGLFRNIPKLVDAERVMQVGVSSSCSLVMPPRPPPTPPHPLFETLIHPPSHPLMYTHHFRYLCRSLLLFR